jgi:hypothetical protein
MKREASGYPHKRPSSLELICRVPRGSPPSRQERRYNDNDYKQSILNFRIVRGLRRFSAVREGPLFVAGKNAEYLNPMMIERFTWMVALAECTPQSACINILGLASLKANS